MRKRSYYRVPYRQAVRYCFFIGDSFRQGSGSKVGDRLMHDSLLLLLDGYWRTIKGGR